MLRKKEGFSGRLVGASVVKTLGKLLHLCNVCDWLRHFVCQEALLKTEIRDYAFLVL